MWSCTENIIVLQYHLRIPTTLGQGEDFELVNSSAKLAYKVIFWVYVDQVTSYDPLVLFLNSHIERHNHR